MRRAIKNDQEREEANKNMLEKQSLKNGLETVAVGVFHLKILFVNAYFVDTPENAPGDDESGFVDFQYHRRTPI